MCRIAGILDKTQPTANLRTTVKTMCQLLQHGGPDDEGIFASEEGHLVLGNRRLSLLDLSAAGHQPMSYCERYTITYNGELYNFPELKTELIQKGYTFTSNSDTEVILASFAAWGTHAFEKFNGMFAFALWDKKESILYLVRDPSGIKPLYYSVSNERLVFASEIKAFKPIPDLQKENPNWPVYMMAYGHLPEPITTLQYVKPLAKGTFLQYSLPEGKWEVTSFASYHYTELLWNRQEVIEQLQITLTKAVARHLLADAPIGVFLSGGIDSSIAALLSNKSSTHLNTLSLYFSEDAYSEKKYQDMVLERLNCDHHQHLLSEKEFRNFLPSIITSMDLPSIDGINTWFISKYARQQGLKAVLSGVGGDELFGGYPSFKRMHTVKNLEKLPNILLKNLSNSGSKKLRRLCYLTLGGAKGKYLFLRGNFIPSEIAGHLDIDEKQVWKILREDPNLPQTNTLSTKNEASWIEMNLYMQNQLLRDCDVMSMAHGVEIRVPFLDKEIITLALQIHPDVKYAGDFPKQLLIDSFKDILPEPIWNRPKMGFSFPFKEWLAKDELLKDTILSSNDFAKNIYKKFAAGDVHWSQLMTLLLLQKHAKA